MAKAICAIANVQAVTGPLFLVGYMVSVDIPITNFGSNFQADTSVSVATNLANLRAKVVLDCAGKGITILTTDVLVFGGPV